MSSAPGADPASGDLALRRETHRLLADIEQTMARQRFNVAVARIMELVNATRKAIDGSAGPADPAVREAAEVVTVALSLVAPYVAEEMWERLGHAPSVANATWPTVDQALLVTESVTCVVQIQGKVRGRLEVPPAISEDELRGAGAGRRSGGPGAGRPRGGEGDRPRAQAGQHRRRGRAAATDRPAVIDPETRLGSCSAGAGEGGQQAAVVGAGDREAGHRGGCQVVVDHDVVDRKQRRERPVGRIGRKPAGSGDVCGTLQAGALQRLHRSMIVDGVEVAGHDQRMVEVVDHRSAYDAVLGAPAIAATVGVARMHGHQPDGPDAGNAHGRHPLLERGIADRTAAAQREARVDRGIGEAVPRIAERVRKALVPAVWFEGPQSGRRCLDQDHDVGLRRLFRRRRRGRLPR